MLASVATTAGTVSKLKCSRKTNGARPGVKTVQPTPCIVPNVIEPIFGEAGIDRPQGRTRMRSTLNARSAVLADEPKGTLFLLKRYRHQPIFGIKLSELVDQPDGKPRVLLSIGTQN